MTARGVVGEIAHLDRRAPEHLQRLERCDEALQVHRGRECTREPLPDPQIGRHFEVLEVEGRDLLERGRRDEAAVDLPVRLVDGHEHERDAGATQAPSRRRSRRTRRGCSRSAPASAPSLSCPRRCSRESQRARPSPGPRRRLSASFAAGRRPRARGSAVASASAAPGPTTWSTRCGWIHSPPFAIAA